MEKEKEGDYENEKKRNEKTSLTAKNPIRAYGLTKETLEKGIRNQE